MPSTKTDPTLSMPSGMPIDLLAAGISRISPDFELDWKEYFLPNPGEDFYPRTVRKIVPTCGLAGAHTYDFHATLKTLDKELQLNLDETDSFVLSQMLTELSTATRFRQDLHMDKAYGENSAVHSSHCLILMTEMFRRAGLLSPESQTEQISRLRVICTLGCLVHDMGEILGEISSLAQRTNYNIAEDVGNRIERRIFEHALRLAYYSDQKNDPTIFSSSIQELRHRFSIARSEMRGLDDFQQILRKYSVDLSAPYEGRVRFFLRIFDIVEGVRSENDNKEELFCGYAVKLVEHIQGTRHLNRFADHRVLESQSKRIPKWSRSRVRSFDGPILPTLEFQNENTSRSSSNTTLRLTLPTSLVTSLRIVKGLKYNEEGLGELFRCFGDNEDLLALAKTIRNTCYQSTIEWLSCGNVVIDREATTIDPELKRLQEELWFGHLQQNGQRMPLGGREIPKILGRIEGLLLREQRKNIKRHKILRSRLCHLRRGDKDDAVLLGRARHKLLPVETSARLMSLYQTALNRDYIPKPGEVLGLCRTLPRELCNFDLFDWSQAPRWQDS
ncbi:MAG: hypothetical protein GYA55_06785 [SAR324 cluster bacterium]|uniref:Uncharacterized protein n=1 Tax=SAR324 cluster bacterium TaxID=2024889 RepID=A0A7X9IJP5_9DELT|nr:hypothetical protein [SAR324 cluster bacterium]